MAKAELRRVFFALWPPAAAARVLHAAAREAQQGCRGRLTRLDSVHLTLAFLGGIPAERLAQAQAAAASIRAAPFDWQVDRLGYWKHNRILWAGGDAPPLAALADDLAVALRQAGFELEKRPFAAHVTLLRDARCPAVPPLAAPVPWPVREFVLVESRLEEAGSRYEIIGRWPLGADLH